MKTPLAIFASLALAASAGAVEYVTLRPGQSRALQPTDLVEFTIARTLNNFAAQVTVVFADDSSDVFQVAPGTATYVIRFSLTGIKNVSVQEQGLLTLKITPASEITAVGPTNVLVIPENSEGNFNIIMESSGDMVTWNPFFSQMVDSESAANCFRVRIVKAATP